MKHLINKTLLLLLLGLICTAKAQNNRNAILDYTTYDWQSNYAARNLTKVWSDGKINFAFTIASNASFSDRGTAICAYDASSDTWFSSGGRVENETTGFGSIAQYGENGLVVAAHTSTDCTRVYIAPDKDNITPNSLSLVSVLDNTYNPCYPAVMTSGTNRNIIHIAANANGSFNVPGAENATFPMIYFRSSDGGQTWDKQNIVLPYTGDDYCVYWRTNTCYWMETTDDNCLALVVNNPYCDGMVLYSYDDGDTWQRKVFYEHPNPFGDFNQMTIYPRWTSCQWDDQHHLHVLYEYNGYTGGPGGGGDFCCRYIGGVAYWNETMPYRGDGTSAISAIPGNLVSGEPFVMDSAYLMQDIHRSWFFPNRTHDFWPEYIGYCTPLDDYGFVDEPENIDNFPLLNQNERYCHGNYRNGICSFPVLCKAGNNEWVAVWCGLDENHRDDDYYYYFHIFASFSADNGNTWTRQVHLTNGSEFNNRELVYLQAAVVNNKLIIAVEEDGEGGTFGGGGAYEGDENPNDCFYHGLTFDLDKYFHNEYTITASPTPLGYGSVTGAGTYSYGQACTLTAIPSTGFAFINWTRNDTIVSTDPSYSFHVANNASYVAHFAMTNYNITATVSPSYGGTVLGVGSYTYGQTATLTVNMYSNYSFENWTENNEIVSTDPSYSFEVTNNRHLVAHLVNTVNIGENEEKELLFYPNPTNGTITIELPNSWLQQEQPPVYRITNAMGQTLISGQIVSQKQQIKVSDLSAGMYYFTIGETRGSLFIVW